MRAYPLAVLLVGCSQSGGSAPPAPPPAVDLSCEAKPDPHCAHPIDRVVVPMLRKAGLSIREASVADAFRRMSIDFIGRTPTPEEADAAAGRSFAENAEVLMAMPEYAIAQARSWGEIFGYDLSFKNWYGDTYDLDELARRLYAPSPLGYASFAGRAVMHPAFYSVHQGDDWPAFIYAIFLGRQARPDEIASLRPLEAIWAQRAFCDGHLWFEAFQSSAQAAIDLCAGGGGYTPVEWAANTCQCTLSPLGCRSAALGRLVDFGMDCIAPNDPTSEKNWVRTGGALLSPGMHTTTCPDGSARPECVDRIVDFDAFGNAAPGAPLPNLAAPPQGTKLWQLGEALASRPDFWEAAADRELQRFVGWWKQGVRRPDFDIPAVRAVVAGVLRANGSIPEIQKLIATSLLYLAPQEPPPGAVEPPLWSMGPTKLLAAEPWIDSAARATLNAPLGWCDYRFVGAGFVGIDDEGPLPFADRSLVAKVPSPLAAKGLGELGYYSASIQLGGCNADGKRPLASSVAIAYAQHDLAKTLCAYGASVLPAPFDPGDTTAANLARGADHVVRRLLGRAPNDEERAAFTSDMASCLAAGAAGCSNAEAATRWLCVRVLDSAAFSLY